jgi:hypothetical protein
VARGFGVVVIWQVREHTIFRMRGKAQPGSPCDEIKEES